MTNKPVPSDVDDSMNPSETSATGSRSFECLACYLKRQKADRTCNGDLAQARKWGTAHPHIPCCRCLLQSLQRVGALCDCEALYVLREMDTKVNIRSCRHRSTILFVAAPLSDARHRDSAPAIRQELFVRCSANSPCSRTELPTQ